MQPGRDIWWHELVKDKPASLPAVAMDSEAPLFILYTSGSTGKPKGIKHTTAGYTLWAKTTAEWVFDLRDDDLFDFLRVQGHNQITDLYLLGLAVKHGGCLVTFDQAIALSSVRGAARQHLKLL